MRVLQVGGGSMGTRRMRDLTALSTSRPHDPIEIRLLDARADRRDAARDRFGITGVSTLAEGLDFEPDALVVSTPPHLHQEFVAAALERGSHVFCEADIWPFPAELVRRAQAARSTLVAAPSATLRFQPVIQEVSRIVHEEIGTVHAFGYLLSVDAPSWHPGEGLEYYARHRPTAPAREMTAFELIALQGIFGPAASVSGLVQQSGRLGTDAEDTYALQYRTESGGAGNLTVVMASPQVVRRGWAIGDHGVVHFDLLAGTVDRQLPGRVTDRRTICDWATTLEQVYRAEMSTFIAATERAAEWPFTYGESNLVCSTLAAAELSTLTGRIERVELDLGPAHTPDAYPLPTGSA